MRNDFLKVDIKESYCGSNLKVMPPISNSSSIKNTSHNISKEIDFDKEMENEDMIKTNAKKKEE